jgi:3-deoxy-D-manno-octulosonic-acid transferase
MHQLYNLGIQAYGLLIRIAALFNEKARKWIDGRHNFFKNLPGLPQKPICWVHCASLGEFDMVLPVLRKIKEKKPEYYLVVTFFSPSGMEHYQKRQHPIDLALYLPLDTSKNAKRFMNYLKPEIGIIVKYEFWHNHIFEAKKNGSKLFSVGTILRENQHYFKKYGGFFRKTLMLIDCFFTQNENTIELLSAIGIKQSVLTGDPRFDQVIQNKKQFTPNSRIEMFLKGRKALIIGSSWKTDEKILFPYILKNTELAVIIAPHEIGEANISRIEKSLYGLTQRYTEENSNDKNILILNTIGNLNSAYHYGSYAYVGGGFSGRLHNILEPAVFGLPVIFGPYHNRFPEAQAFISNGIGFSVSTTEEIHKISEMIFENNNMLRVKAESYVEGQSGTDEKIISAMF